MHILRFLPFFFVCWVLVACNSSGNQADSVSAADTNDFDNFYKKFHRDSAFQMEHILFPLQGIPSMVDSAFLASGKMHYWNEGDWLLHNEIDFENNTDYKRDLKVTDFLVEERIFDKNNFFILRRFYFMEGKWMLIYYSDLNPSDRKKEEGEETVPAEDSGS